MFVEGSRRMCVRVCVRKRNSECVCARECERERKKGERDGGV